MKKYLITAAMALLPWAASAQVCFDGTDCTGAPALANPISGTRATSINSAISSLGVGVSNGQVSATNLLNLINTKMNVPSGSAGQCVLGNGTVGTCPGAIASLMTPSRSLVLTTSSTGFQLSATNNAFACYSGTLQNTTSIGGPSSVSIFFETADTNSTSPGAWTVIGEQTSTKNVTLAVALQSVDGSPWNMCRVVAAGKYARLRYQANQGTVSATVSPNIQEIIY